MLSIKTKGRNNCSTYVNAQESSLKSVQIIHHASSMKPQSTTLEIRKLKTITLFNSFWQWKFALWRIKYWYVLLRKTWILSNVFTVHKLLSLELYIICLTWTYSMLSLYQTGCYSRLPTVSKLHRNDIHTICLCRSLHIEPDAHHPCLLSTYSFHTLHIKFDVLYSCLPWSCSFHAFYIELEARHPCLPLTYSFHILCISSWMPCSVVYRDHTHSKPPRWYNS